MSIALSQLHDRDRVNLVEPGRLHPAVSFARASTATYMGSNGLLKTAAVNEPRYEYDAAGNYLGLLFEETRTNSFQKSQQLDDAYWSKINSTVTADTAIAPDGTTTADTITKTDAGAHYCYRPAGTPMVTCTLSLFVKAGTASIAGLYVGGTSGGVASFTLTGAGTATLLSGAGSVAIYALANGWYRIALTTSPTVSSNAGFFLGTGSAGDSVYAWGMQCEAGSFTTSYIPTTTAAVTRSADVCQVSDLTKIGFNAAAGTLLATIDSASPNENITRGISALGSSARLMYENTGAVLVYNGVSSASRAKPAVGTIFKVATSYGSRVAVAAAGVAFSNVSAIGMTGSTLAIGGLVPGGNVYCGHIQRLTYLPRQLPDAELARNAP